MRQKRRPVPPLDAASLRDLALAYVGRFATTRVRLERYLARKLRERGWAGPGQADVAELAAQLVELRYVDDAQYAGMKARALSQRGFGARRVDQALWHAGVDVADRDESDAVVEQSRLASALRLAQRKRWGPYAAEPQTDSKQRERMIAAFMRAGHDGRLARRILMLAPGADVSALEDPDQSRPPGESGW